MNSSLFITLIALAVIGAIAYFSGHSYGVCGSGSETHRAKGKRRVYVDDAISFAGLNPGHYEHTEYRDTRAHTAHDAPAHPHCAQPWRQCAFTQKLIKSGMGKGNAEKVFGRQD